MMTLFGNQPATNCRRCGRRLTDPQSVQRGIGPVCWAKGHRFEAATEDDNEFTDFFLFDSIEDGIVLMRDSMGVHTNVPHLVTHHSPSGYEFGYGGSGPADLALNIVELILRSDGFSGEAMLCWDGNRCFIRAWQLHQEFKREFIADVSEEGAVIPYEGAERWVMEKSDRIERRFDETERCS